MKRLFCRIFDVREGEWGRALLMAAFIFLIIASLMILKAVRNALFLSVYGAGRLPFVFVLVAVFAAVAAPLNSRARRAVPKLRPIQRLTTGSIVLLAGFWVLLGLQTPPRWLYFVFYVWVSIFGVVLSTQFWLLANEVFDAREARRLFNLLAAGAIAGGIAGGYLAKLLAPRVRTENLILVCAFFMAMCMVIAWIVVSRVAVRRPARTGRVEERRIAETPAWRLVFSSRHLSAIAGIVGLGVLVATLADYQYSAIAADAIGDTDRLTAFFGFWLSNLSVLSLLIQLFVAGPVLRRRGVVFSLFFLPLAILLGAAGVLVIPALWTAVVLKVGDGAFKHSINKSGLELLYFPVPAAVKQRAKGFIDIVVDNAAKGVAGLLLILLVSRFGLSARAISVATLLLTGGWLALVLFVRRSYVAGFRRAITTRALDPEEISSNLEDGSVVESVLSFLDGDNERQIVYVLHLLEGTSPPGLAPRLPRLVGHPAPAVKRAALAAAAGFDEPDLSNEARALAGDADDRLAHAAVRYLAARTGEPAAFLRRLLDEGNARERAAAAVCAAELGRMEAGFRKELDIAAVIRERIAAADGPDAGAGSVGDVAGEPAEASAKNAPAAFLRRAAATAIGRTGDRELAHLLEPFLRDPDPSVVSAAARSAGELRAHGYLPFLVRLLSDNRIHREVRSAIASFGDDAVDHLAGVLGDARESRSIRIRVPRVLAEIGTERAAAVLMDHADRRDRRVVSAVLRGVGRIRTNDPSIRIDRSKVEGRVVREARRYLRLVGALEHYDGESGAATRLLARAIREKCDFTVYAIFHLLGMRYPPKEIFDAWVGVQSTRREQRANALEFLDNILSEPLKRIVIPIVETPLAAVLIERLRGVVDVERVGRREALASIIAGEDNWLRAVAIHAAAESNERFLSEEIASYEGDPDPVVAEAAALFRRRARAN